MPYITSLVGMVAGYRETSLRKSDPSWLLRLDQQEQWLSAEGLPMSSEEIGHIMMPFAFQLIGAFFVSVMLSVIIRLIWLQIEKRRSTIEVRYSDGAHIKVPSGTTILEASRLAGVSHASICGGNGRCSTCRTRILIGDDGITAPVGEELSLIHI